MPPEAEQPGLSKEGEQIVQLFAERVSNDIKQLNLNIRDQVQQLEGRLDGKISDLRTEIHRATDAIHEELVEVKEEQVRQRESIEAQGKDLTEVKTRLNEGDRRFEALEDKNKEQDQAIADHKVNVAKVAGASAATGGLIGFLLSKFAS